MPFAKTLTCIAICCAFTIDLRSAPIFNCGKGLTCMWQDDTETRGALILVHAGAIIATGELLKNIDLISPTGFWKVHFDHLTESVGVDSDSVSLRGYMQHIKKPTSNSHSTDVAAGEQYAIALYIQAAHKNSVETYGDERHKPHTDAYYGLLEGTPEGVGSNQFASYGFGISGKHPEFSKEAGVPEPTPVWLLGGGVALLAGLRRLGSSRPCGDQIDRQRYSDGCQT